MLKILSMNATTPPRFTFIDVPLACAARTGGMAKGPEALRLAGLAEALTAIGGHDGGTALPPTVTTQHQAAFQAARERAMEALADRPRPLLLLGGDCTIACATLAVARGEKPLLLWLDAHGDFNTPQTTPSGYWPGMPLAQVAGLATPLGQQETLIPGADIALIGARDLDPGEDQNAEGAGAHLLAGPLPSVETLTRRAPGSPVWIHLDLDVLDPREMPAVNFPVPGGLSMAELTAWLAQVGQRFDVRGLEVTAFDAQRDPEGHVAGRLVQFLTDVVRATWKSSE